MAEELLQETLLRATRAAASDIRRPRAWLLRIALNTARDHARRRAVRPQLELASDVLDGHGQGPNQEESLFLKQIILSLPLPVRDVFVLSRFEGLTYAEIAERRGISVKTVEWRMTKALKLCAEMLRG